MNWWNRVRTRWTGQSPVGRSPARPEVEHAPTCGLTDRHILERCEREARALLAAGDVDRALESAQRQEPHTSSSLMLLNICRILAGRRVEAQLDLTDWSKRACCPMDARILLALLRLEDGDRRGAIASLARNVAQIDDPNTIQAMIVIHAERKDAGEAQRWAQRLCQLAVFWTDRPMVAGWLRAVGLEVCECPAEPPDALVEQLALEVLACESVIPSLEAAARYDLSHPRALLLLRALESAFDRLEAPVPACEAMARLALTLGDAATARRWIDVGLGLNPLCAPLAILLSTLPAADCAEIERAGAEIAGLPRRREQIEALDVVISAHPDWHDLRRVRRRLEAA